MSRRRPWLAGALLFFAVVSAAQEGPGGESAFEAGERAYERGDYREALSHFERAAAGRPTPAVLYNIGVCQYRLGEYRASEMTFRHMADRYPDMRQLAEYNIGLAALRQHRPDEAARAFERAASGADPAVVRLARAALERIEGPEGPSQRASGGETGAWGYVYLAAGYDDNVALLEDTGVETGRTTDSPFAEFFGQIGRPATRPGMPSLAASLYSVVYPDAEEFDQNVARLGASWALPVSGLAVELGPHVSWSTLDGDGFERRVGLGATATAGLGPSQRLELHLVFEDAGDLESRFAFVEGTHRLMRIRLVQERSVHRLRIGYELVVDDRDSAAIDATRHRLAGDYRRRIDADWAVRASISWRRSRFDELAVQREEDLAEARLAIERRLPAGWQLTGEYRYSSNRSNVDGFDYQRNRLTLAFDRVF